MSDVGHFGCPNFTFDRISGHFRSIRNFDIFEFFWQNGCRRPFWCPKFTLDHISGHFRSIQIFYFFEFFYKMAAGGHFGCPKITFDLIYIHFTSIRNFKFFDFFTKWLPAAILDVRKSLSISFLSISHRYATCNFFKFLTMADVGQFGCPNFTFDRISGHFRSIPNFNYYFIFDKKNGWRRPFWMSKIHFRSHFWPFQIDMQLKFFWIFLTNGCRRPFWMSENHFRSHFYPFQSISHRLRNFYLFWNFWQNGWRRPFWMSEFHFRSHFWPFQIDRPFWISKIHFRSQFWPFQIHTELYLFFKFFDKMAACDHFGCPQITFDGISGHFRSIRNFKKKKIDKMAAGGHFGWGDNVSYRTRPRYLDE